MDDISTAAKTWSEAIEKLELVLQTMESNNLSCQPQKSSFCFSSIKFLGYEISKDGLGITDEKIKMIKALKVPHDKKSLQKVWGLFNCFRQYCPLYAKFTYNMRLLLKQNTPWNSLCRTEFDAMISKLTNAPVLQPLSVNKDFVIYHIYFESSVTADRHSIHHIELGLFYR